MLGMFAVREDDEIAQKAASVIRSRFPVKDLKPWESAGANDIALVGWARTNKNGLRHGFPGGHLRLAPERRILRTKLPEELRVCKQVVYIRDNPAQDTNAFTLAVLTMLAKFGLPIESKPLIENCVHSWWEPVSPSRPIPVSSLHM